MKRLLLVPLLAATALAGCATDYAYRGGDRGDYYYGRPSVEYRYHDPYGYGPYGGFYYGYGAPFGYFGGRSPYYRNPYYGYPYYGYPYYYRPPVVQRPPSDGNDVPRDNDRRPPWRDLRPRRPVVEAGPGNAVPMPAPQRVTPRHSDGGSRMEQMIRRGRERVQQQER